MIGKNTPFEWGKEKAEEFKQIKNIISKDVLLQCSKYNQPFTGYIDDLNYQVRGVVLQAHSSIAFFKQNQYCSIKAYKY